MKVNNSAEIRRRIDELKRRKRAVILAHYYTCLLYTSDAADEL